MEKTCKEIEELLVDYADGQLSSDNSERVAEHLAQCENCRKVLNALQRSLELSGIIWTDGFTETENIHIPIQRKIRKLSWRHYAAIAASILLAVTTSIVWRALVKPAEKAPSLIEIERSIIEEGTAAKLLTATDLLASKPHTEALIKSQYEYIVTHYPNTKAAATAKMRIP
ncbi:MAG: zf-HC2 domain-containing protein [Sedimentisphaerales bacterium]|nr:zf-HC2 domain-containing protein [Sedimentisphaerales bacterium]